jgi:hypothetical protein
VESGGHAKAWLLGAQPESLKLSRALSPAIETTLAILTGLVASLMGEGIQT